MTRSAAVPAMVLASVLAGIQACLDSTGPRPGENGNSVGLIVSAPVRVPSGAGTAAIPGAPPEESSASVVYVSLPPGSAPSGMRATITNRRTGLSVTTPVLAGGFDPVPIAASLQDVLLIEIAATAVAPPVRVSLTVKPARPLKVVRTNPPSGGRDVPLNAAIVIVFSEPIDSATFTTESVQLWRGTTLVAGTVGFGDASHLRGEFHPDELLASQTDYQLIVTQALHDANGVALDAPLTVSFTTGTTAPISGLVFASVSAGEGHSCGVTSAGQAYCWGTGVLGNGSFNNMTPTSGTPVLVAGGLTFASVSAGWMSTCGVTTEGAAYCWGIRDGAVSGLMGADSTTLASNCLANDAQHQAMCPTPVPVAGGHTFKMVSVGTISACGIATNGAAYCWGNDYLGGLGDGCTLASCPWSSSGPVAVAGGHAFVTLSTGDGFACAVATDGATYCWGQSGPHLGAGPTPSTVMCSNTPCTSTPVAVMGGLTFQTISAGSGYACGVVSTGAAYCWGINSQGQLSTGSSAGPETCGGVSCSTAPVPVNGGLAFNTMNVENDNCGLSTDGAAYCWFTGANPITPSLLPVPVSGGLRFASLSKGWLHTCGVTLDGVAYCWGTGGFGALGTGTTADSPVPVKVAGQP